MAYLGTKTYWCNKKINIKNIENNFKNRSDEFDALMTKESTERWYKRYIKDII